MMRLKHGVNISVVLLCLSSNHHNASFDLLDKLSVVAAQATTELMAASDFITGSVVLATCNRFEAYLDIDEPLTAATAVAVASTLDALSRASGIPIAELQESIAVHVGTEVASHLFAVTAGLESVVVGEDEIAGQVATALNRARRDGTTSRDLERLFQKATSTSRGVKNRTAIGGAGRSLVRLALELASSRITSWAETRVLLVGTGQYAATTVAALRDRGAVDIRVFSPRGRGGPFAAKHGLLLSDSFDVEVVITCTATVVLGVDRFPASKTEPSSGARQLVIDLGLPRNVNPAVAQLPGVQLLDLETIKLHAPLEELTAHDDAREIIRTAAQQFTAETAAEPAIVALRRHVFAVLEDELARARARGVGEETEAALRHLAGVLVHEPSLRAREFAAAGRLDEFVAGLDAVYGVRPDPELLRPAERPRSETA